MTHHVAIETNYMGCRFRSRLEARWAVFFDTLRVPWEYEKQGYVIGGVPYLPDFWLPVKKIGGRVERLPAHGCWVEIKGAAPSDEEKFLLLGLTRDTGHAGLLLSGGIGRDLAAMESVILESLASIEMAAADELAREMIVPKQGDSDCRGAVMFHCPEPLWALFHLATECTSSEEVFGDPWPFIHHAIATARSARFEHGETSR